MRRINFGRYSYVEIHDGYIYLHTLNREGRQIRQKIYDRGVLITLLVLVGVLIAEIVVNNRYFGLEGYKDAVIYIISAISIIYLSIMIYRRLMEPITTDPKYLRVNHNICFTPDHASHDTVDCINEGDHIVKVGMFFPREKIDKEDVPSIFKDFTITGYEPTYLRYADAKDVISPTKPSVSVGISKSGKLYPFANLTDYTGGFDPGYDHYHAYREQFYLKLSRYDYAFDLGYIVEVTYYGGITADFFQGIIIRRKNTEPTVYSYFRGWNIWPMKPKYSWYNKVNEHLELLYWKYGVDDEEIV